MIGILLAGSSPAVACDGLTGAIGVCSPPTTVAPPTTAPPPSTTAPPPTTAPPSTTTAPAPPPTTSTVPAEPPSAPDAAAAAHLLDLVNTDRRAAGLGELAARGDVDGIAGGWSTHLAEVGDLSHDDAYFTMRSQLGARMLGENVARNSDLDDAHRRLMASPGHRANILQPAFSIVGIGVVRAGGEWWVTEDFLQPAPPSQGASRVTPAASNDSAPRPPAVAPPVDGGPPNTADPSIVRAALAPATSLVHLSRPAAARRTTRPSGDAGAAAASVGVGAMALVAVDTAAIAGWIHRHRRERRLRARRTRASRGV